MTKMQLSSTSKNNSISSNSTASPLPKQPLFFDATLQSGINFVHFQGDEIITGLNEIIGPGACVIDYDGDGWQDLFIVGGSGQTRFFGKAHWWQAATSSKLYKNMKNGRFVDVTINAGLDQQYWGIGCTTGDLDNDGDSEIFVTTFAGNYLYRNNGNNTFSDISQIAGIQGDSWSTSVSVADYNKDGLLDIYVVNYLEFDKTLRTLEAQSGFNTGEKQFLDATNFDSTANVLYQNMGNLHFKDVTKFSQVGNETGRGLSAIWTDLNNDQYPDLIIGNDRNSPNAIYMNQKNGKFANVSNEFKFGDLSGSNGIAVADLNNDGLNDMVISGGIGKLPKVHLSQTSNTIKPLTHYHYADQDQAYSFFQNPHTLIPLENWTIGLQDFNNDGFIDVFFTNGLKNIDLDVPRITVGQRNLLKLNHGGRQLLKADESYPFSKTLLSSRGAVFFDFDHDGDIDIFVSNNNDMARLYRNDSAAGNWLNLQLIAANGPRDAIGAKVWLKSDSREQYREITSGAGFLSNSSYRLHFGLGNDHKISTLKIQWPQGENQFIELASINRSYVIREGIHLASTLAPSVQAVEEPLGLTMGAKDPVNRSLYLEILWNTNSTLFFQEAKKALHDSSSQVRFTAITLLAEKKDKQMLELLLQQLDETTIQNLIVTIKAISRYEDEQSITWLLSLFSHPSQAIKLTTIEQFIHFFKKEEALVHRKFLAVPYLIHLLSDRDTDVKLAAIKTLGLSESYRAVAPLLKLLTTHHPDIQAAAANSLGHIRERKAINALVKLASDMVSPENVRAQALFALKRIGYDAEKLALSLLEQSNTLDQSSNNIGLMYYLLSDHIDGIVLNQKRISRVFKSWLIKHVAQLDNNFININTRTYFFLINLITSQNFDFDNYDFSKIFQHKDATVRLYMYLAQIEHAKHKYEKMLLHALGNEPMRIQKKILRALSDFTRPIDIPLETVNKLLHNKETAVDLIDYYGNVFTQNAGVLLTQISADENQQTSTRIAALAALIAKPYLNELLPEQLLMHKNMDIRHLAIKYWSLSQLSQKKRLHEPPIFMRHLEKTNDYIGIIETCRNRDEAWAHKLLLKIVSRSEIPFTIRQQAISVLASSKTLHNDFSFLTQLKNNDELLLQDFLKHAVFNLSEQKNMLLEKIFFNEEFLPTTRLLAAKHLKSNTARLINTLTKEHHETP